MDHDDKLKFRKYLVVLFFVSFLSVIGIGVIIPFINILIQPELTMKYNYWKQWNYTTLVFMFSTLMILAFLIKNISSFFMLKYQFGFLFEFMSKIQIKLFNKYLSHPYEYHINRSTPELIKNINNETSILSLYVVAPFGNFLTEVISSLFILFFLLIINFLFTSLVIFFLGTSIILLMKITKTKAAYYSKLRSVALSEMTNSVISGLEGIKELKIYHKELYFFDDFVKNADSLSKSSAFQLVFQQSPRMMIEFLGLSVIMGLMCVYIFNGAKSNELFVLLGVFGVAAAQLLPSINRLTQALTQIKYGMLSLEVIYKELHQMDKQKYKKLSLEHNKYIIPFNKKIELKNLSHIYQDGTVALKDICLTIPKGYKIALVGKSGSGKTSLADCLLGLYDFKHGEILVDDKLIQSIEDSYAFQKLFGYIPQFITLYNKTLAENIAFGIASKEIDYNRIWECLEKAKLDDFVHQLPYKENTIIGEKGMKLSGGQRQRIGIARALYQQPTVLIMDEATSALDNITEKEIMQVFDQLNDITIVTIAHRLSTIKEYNLIYVLESGKIIDSGDFYHLMHNCSFFREMVLSGDNPKNRW